MQETVMILSECEEINSLLYKPIVATQRIKYTCLNVSASYIVLGSTSGSLYLFTRGACIFQQLIPLSEGPVSCVVISPDEKTIALATKRGSVCLVALKPTVKLLAVSSEHLGELVTSLCWNDNSSEIYIGDGIGKISTMVLTIFTVNGMFQPPTCALMHLDSTIVQMQFSGHLLLVSTMTRCYLCDTSLEQFKQIGNKARDGEFGACFLEKFVDRDKRPLRANGSDDKVSGRKGTFNFISEPNSETRDDQDLKIYCARPGFRLWEVTANGIVVKTHQFKEALAVPPSSLYRSSSTKPTVNRPTDRTWVSPVTNFSHLHVLCRKYLFSYTTSGLYIIDPANAAVVLWSNEYAGISIARTIDDRIYLMTETGTFHCLALSSAESMILRLYEKKRYNECLRACNVLRPELARSIGIKDSSHRNGSHDETDNSTISQSNEITATLLPLISLIQSNINAQPIKLTSGIVVVNAGNGKIRNDEIRHFGASLMNNTDVNGDDVSQFPETKIDEDAGLLITDIDPVICENFVRKKPRSLAPIGNDRAEQEICTNELSRMTLNDNSNGSPEAQEDSEETAENRENSRIDEITASIQSDLNPVYVVINNLKPSMADSEIEEAVLKIRKLMSNMNESYGNIVELKDFLYEVLRSTERHYYNVLLDSLSRELLLETRHICVVNEAVGAFVDINSSIVDECTCGYCYPVGNHKQPKFLEIGKTLVERFADECIDDCTKLCNSVPFMWRVYLPILVERSSITDDILSMCLRTKDNVVLSVALRSLDVKQWSIAVNFLIDIEEEICPCCGRRDESPNAIERPKIEWSGVAREIMKREGPSAAMSFLQLVETVLPKTKLDKSIFQSLIFTKILEHHGVQHTVEFDRKHTGNSEYEAMSSPKVQEQLVESLEKDLERPIEQTIFGTGPHHWGLRFQAKSSTCPCCTLSLQTPVLLGNNGISVFPCGHAYHVNCLIQRKLTRCNLH